MTDGEEDGVEYVTPTEAYLRRRLQQMDPYQFEHLVGDVWDALGWNTRVVGEPGDRGIDVVATRGEQKQLLQAKRYGAGTTVGSPEVQQYASLRLQEDGVDGVTIVTTGGFSRQAEDMAPELEVLLVDGEDLLGVLDGLEGWAVVARYFEDIQLAEDVDGAGDGGDEGDGVFGRFQSWLG